MGHSTSITITIAAPPAAVWALLADIESWPTWTKSVDTASRGEAGLLAVGSTATIKQPKLAKSHWVITELEPERNFTWASKSPGVTSTGSHRIQPTADGGSEVTLTLDQTGPLAAVIRLFAGRLLDRYVGWEAAGLKAAAEAGSSA